jgi:lipopolysaccharide export system protein LptA
MCTERPRPVDVHSDKFDYDDKKKKVRLLGNVKIVSDKVTVTSPYAELFTDKKTAEFRGGVKMVGLAHPLSIG